MSEVTGEMLLRVETKHPPLSCKAKYRLIKNLKSPSRRRPLGWGVWGVEGGRGLGWNTKIRVGVGVGLRGGGGEASPGKRDLRDGAW